ncbi:transposase-like zinc-binding domain-containing protein [Deinococcus frigens]|uniref:IS1/IS1595 family N-terminal zinc-binding domain-containing protein n=1 Tax=Deinococcus frigens TaxID=249403 RepID=UPI0012EB4075|nr:IS1 family transposase [Deinococcus frigens]
MNSLKCPQCRGVYIVKNGHAHTGKQRYLCRACTYQSTLNHIRPSISAEKVELVDRLLSERISHRGICRVVGVSRTWFRRYLQSLIQTVPHRSDPQEVVFSKG